MTYPRKDNTLSMLGGAVVGALAMYLLDPESGEQRRRRVAETTGEAAARASETFGPMWERMSETAKAAATSLAAGATAAGHGIAEKYEDVRDSRATSRLTGKASDLSSRVAERIREAASAPADWFRHDEPSHAGAYAATGISTLVLGAG